MIQQLPPEKAREMLDQLEMKAASRAGEKRKLLDALRTLRAAEGEGE